MNEGDEIIKPNDSEMQEEGRELLGSVEDEANDMTLDEMKAMLATLEEGTAKDVLQKKIEMAEEAQF